MTAVLICAELIAQALLNEIMAGRNMRLRRKGEESQNTKVRQRITSVYGFS